MNNSSRLASEGVEEISAALHLLTVPMGLGPPGMNGLGVGHQFLTSKEVEHPPGVVVEVSITIQN